jgi:uncharacterized protein with FMN-binding domain
MRIVGALLVLLSLLVLASCAVDKEALALRIDLLDVDLSTVADGTYEAAYTISPPAMAANKTVKVKVIVAGGAYQSIEIVEPAQLGGNKVFAALVARISESGRLSMDAVSGATITSAAVLKAVQLAVGGPAN